MAAMTFMNTLAESKALETTVAKLDRLHTKAIQGKISKLEESGDGKRGMMGIVDDGYDDFRIEIDTDDCNKTKAIASAKFMRELWNAWPKIREALKP